MSRSLRPAGDPIDDFHGAHHGNHALPTTDTKRRIFLAEVRSRLPAGGKPIRTCMGLFLSSGCLGCADSFLLSSPAVTNAVGTSAAAIRGILRKSFSNLFKKSTAGCVDDGRTDVGKDAVYGT
jgi:hypothetical protein